MDHRVRFEREATADDGFGNVTNGTWSALVTRWARVKPEKGREQVEAGRLESTMRGVLTVRREAATIAITPADRAVFVVGPYSGKTVNIRSIIPGPDNSTIEFVFEEGVAT
jgi:head-tail adaptor